GGGVAPRAGARAWQHQPRRAQARRRPQHAVPENARAAHPAAGQKRRRLTGAVVTVACQSQKKRIAPRARTLSLTVPPARFSASVGMYSATRFRLGVSL